MTAERTGQIRDLKKQRIGNEHFDLIRSRRRRDLEVTYMLAYLNTKKPLRSFSEALKEKAPIKGLFYTTMFQFLSSFHLSRRE